MELIKQNNKNVYSDGDIEDRIIEYLDCKKNMDEIIEDIPEGAVFHNFNQARENLINWYPFKEEDTVLEIGAGMGGLTNWLTSVCKQVVSIEASSKRAEIIKKKCKDANNLNVIVGNLSDVKIQEKFNYVLIIGVLEYVGIYETGEDPWGMFLKNAKQYLKPNGKLLLAIENKFGLKYWCGAAEDHTGIPFDSINDYLLSSGKTQRYANTSGVRTFSKYELEELLYGIGFEKLKFYYPLPDYKFPMLILTDKSKDSSSLVKSVKFSYQEEATLISNEANLYPQIIDNGMLSFFANSYFIEAFSENAVQSEIDTVTIKRDYKTNYKIATIFEHDQLRKKAVLPEAFTHLREMEKNISKLQERGLKCVDQEQTQNGESICNYIKAERADNALQNAINCDDYNTAIQMLESLKQSLYKSSDYIFQDGSIILKECFLDLTFQNSFWIENELVFFDQEWLIQNIPLKFILYRAIKYALPRAQDQKFGMYYYGISDDECSEFADAEQEFLKNLMDEGNCKWFDPYMYQERLLINSKHKSEIECYKVHVEQLLEGERSLQRVLAEKDAAYNQLVAEKDAAYNKLSAEKDAAYNQLAAEKDEIYKQFRLEKQELEQLIRNKEGHIQLLLEPERELERIKASRSWRFMGYVWKLRDIIVPRGSKRRLIGKITIKFVKHPIRFLGKCTPTRIGKFFYTLKREGVEGTSRKMDDCLVGNDIKKTEIQIVSISQNEVKIISDYSVISVPKWDKPQVSIVIPVYNQFDYTYHCIESIVKNSGNITYEIIIADDCSTDITKQIENVICGIRVIRNAQNIRFLKNCNNAAKYAKGEYILFLNNDTQVQNNWLSPLVELIESDKTIGMVGSKLVYPDGRLQEAGGILWKDGSAWNYGNRSDPDLPEFNYVKDVDYISGAAIMIHSDLWNKIGGFDEQFVPAYYEDTDLAFEVRKNGYRVVYQPLSVVVHFEGVSNGTDTSSGQKAHQIENAKKFYEKWKNILLNEHFDNAQCVFSARDRSRNKETVLVIDHYIPTYDKDAGSRSIDHYLKLLVDLGLNVKFIGDNFYHDTNYAPRYEQWGIEILYGVYYRDHWKDWIKENVDKIDYILLSRPHISIKYIDFLKENTNAKIVYYVQDLHFLREEREYEITKDPELLKSAQRVKKQEMYIMGKSDTVFTLSDVEKSIIDQHFGDGKAVVTPISYYSEFPQNPVDLDGKKGIIFVGGFGHRPNEDGILWFFDKVWQVVSNVLPDCTVTIIGSKPTEKVKALASDKVKITGFISDEELEEYYQKSRLCIIPLRYGAGVKGKTIEAMYHRIPMVSTSVGIEGLEGITEYVQPADDANAFAERVIKLYTDDELAKTRAEGYCKYLKEHYSYESAKDLFAGVFSKGE